MNPYTKTSPSQISTFDRCQRRWYFGSIMRLEQPQGPEAAKGEAMHLEMEGFERDGKLPTHPSCLLALDLDGIRDSVGHEAVLIEWKTMDAAKPVTLGGVTLNGRVDRLDARDAEYPIVWDWKSKGKTLRAMSKKALENDTQLLSYAAAALSIVPTAKGVRLAHGYLGREETSPYAKAVVTEPIPRAVVLDRFAALEPTVSKMKELAAVEDPMQVAGNSEDCWAFGSRCPFYGRCFPDAATGASAALIAAFNSPPNAKEDAMSLLEKLKSNAGAAAIPDPTPAKAALPEYKPGSPPGEYSIDGRTLVAALTGLDASKISTPAPAPGATSSTAPASVLILYIDILPEKGIEGAVRLEDEIARRTDLITKAHGVKSLFEKPLDFGKGKDILVESFRTSPPSGVILASSAGLYSAAIIEVLKPLAPIVCRGF